MERHDSPRDFVARCPVMLFEAPSGASAWNKSGVVGELHVLYLDGGVLALQLRDPVDGKSLFEHKLSKVDDYDFKSERFHTFRKDKGGHRGFAFSCEASAKEFKHQLLCTLPLPVPSYASWDPSSGCSHLSEDSSQLTVPDSWHAATPDACSTCQRASSTADSVAEPSHSGESCMWSSRTRDSGTHRPQPDSSIKKAAAAAAATTRPLLPQDRTPLSTSPTSTFKPSICPVKRMSFRDMLRECLCVDSYEEPEFEIGEPFDVKHVGHIGWDTPSFGGEGWLDNLMDPRGNFSEVPSGDFSVPHARAQAEPEGREAQTQPGPASDGGDEPTSARPDSDIAEAQSPARPECNPDNNHAEETRGEIAPAPTPPPEYRDEHLRPAAAPAAAEPQTKTNTGHSFLRRFF